MSDVCHIPSQWKLNIASESEHDSAEILDDLKVQVFSNYVVMRRCFGWLKPHELIILRRVCKLWNDLCCFYISQPQPLPSLRPTISLHSDPDLVSFMYTYSASTQLQTRFPITSFFVNIWETSVDTLETFASLVSPIVKAYFLQSVELDVDDGEESAQKFAEKEIGKKLMTLLRPAKCLEELNLKSDFEITLSRELLEELKSREAFVRMKILDITYLFQPVDFKENLISTLVSKTPFLKDLSINLSQGYSQSFHDQLPIIFRLPHKIPLISLNITLTPYEADMIQELIDMKCRMHNLVLLLKNPRHEDIKRMMNTLNNFLANQCESLQSLGLFTFNEFTTQKIKLPILRKLRTLNLIFNAELSSPIIPFTSDQFPALESVDLVHIFQFQIFSSCVLPSVKTFTFLGCESAEPWEVIFPNLHTFEVFDTSIFQSLLTHCFRKMTKIVHLRIRLFPFNIIRWGILTGGIPRYLGASVLALAKKSQSNVDIGKFEIPDAKLPSLANMTELKTLEMIQASLDDIEALVFLSITGRIPILNQLRIQQDTDIGVSEEYKRILTEFHHECIFT